jgi:hypothetical protein
VCLARNMQFVDAGDCNVRLESFAPVIIGHGQADRAGLVRAGSRDHDFAPGCVLCSQDRLEEMAEALSV